MKIDIDQAIMEAVLENDNATKEKIREDYYWGEQALAESKKKSLGVKASKKFLDSI